MRKKLFSGLLAAGLALALCLSAFAQARGAGSGGARGTGSGVNPGVILVPQTLMRAPWCVFRLLGKAGEGPATGAQHYRLLAPVAYCERPAQARGALPIRSPKTLGALDPQHVEQASTLNLLSMYSE